VIDHHGVMQYVDTPVLAGVPGQELARSVTLNPASGPGLVSSSN